MNREIRFKFYQIAGKLNNHPALVGSDHVTIMAFMDTVEEMQAHIEHLEKRIKEYDLSKAK